MVTVLVTRLERNARPRGNGEAGAIFLQVRLRIAVAREISAVIGTVVEELMVVIIRPFLLQARFRVKDGERYLCVTQCDVFIEGRPVLV